MKEITISVPDGKSAEWINGVLTLVDEPQVDNRTVTERIKTFEDACNELGDEHPLVEEYIAVQDALLSSSLSFSDDLIAYLKLRIIVAAINEGWEPKFTMFETRYYPSFNLLTKKQYDTLDDERKSSVVYRGISSSDERCGLSYAIAKREYLFVEENGDALCSSAHVGSRLAFRTRELADYAGRKFIEEWADFMLKPYTVDYLKRL